MTIKEYCDIANISKSAVTYRINNNKLLPGIKSYEKKDKTYILTRDKNISTDIIRQSFRAH